MRNESVRKDIILVLIAILLALHLPEPVEGSERVGTHGMVKILQPDEVTEKVLTHRKDKYLVIEVCYGKCINKKKDGKILNTEDEVYNYISYKGVKGCKKGSHIITVLVYENNNGDDTIGMRFDKVVRR